MVRETKRKEKKKRNEIRKQERVFTKPQREEK